MYMQCCCYKVCHLWLTSGFRVTKHKEYGAITQHMGNENSQSRYLHGIINEQQRNKQDENITEIRERRESLISREDQCNNSAFYVKSHRHISIMDQEANAIIGSLVTKVNEALNSKGIEIIGFIKILKELKEQFSSLFTSWPNLMSVELVQFKIKP